MENPIEQFSLENQLNKEPIMTQNKRELEYLINALNYYGLSGYKINEYWQQDKRRTKQLYFLSDDNGTSITGRWDYSEIHHFIMGYGKAFNKFKNK